MYASHANREESGDQLSIGSVRRVLEAQPDHAKPQHQALLDALLAEEAALRGRALSANRIVRARFPFMRTVDEFDFERQPRLRAEMLVPLLSAAFVQEGRSLILTGKPGRGKTHLAVALAYQAILNGFDVRFVSASRLVEAVSSEARLGRARRATLPYLRSKLLVIDDFGYARHNADAASVLFQIVNERYVNGGSMILTANPPPHQWGKLLDDEDAGNAIVGRMLERGVHIELAGPSLRAAACTDLCGSCHDVRTREPEPSSLVNSALRAPAALEPPVTAARPAQTEIDVEQQLAHVARALVGRFGLKEAVQSLRRTMSSEALVRSSGSRRAAANLLGVDRRYVQRLAENCASDTDSDGL